MRFVLRRIKAFIRMERERRQREIHINYETTISNCWFGSECTCTNFTIVSHNPLQRYKCFAIEARIRHELVQGFVFPYACMPICLHPYMYQCNASLNASPLCEIIEMHNQDPLLSISQTRSVNAANELDGWADCESDTASCRKIDRINDAFIIETVAGKSCRTKLMSVLE